MSSAALKLITNRTVIMLSTLAAVSCCGTLWLAGQGPMSTDDSADSGEVDMRLADNVGGATTSTQDGTSGTSGTRPLAHARQQPTEAQRVARLQRTIAADRKQLATLRQQSDDPVGEYREADAEFTEIDAQWAARRQQIGALRRANKTDEAEQLTADSESLERDWQQAKDRFDLAINARRALREKTAALEQKIQQDAGALESLVDFDVQVPPPQLPAEADGSTELTGDGAAATAPDDVGRPPAPDPRAEAPVLPVPSPLAQLALPALAKLPVASDAKAAKEAGQPSLRLAQARKEAETRRTAAREAENRAESVNERVEALRRNIAIEQQLLDMARAKSDQAQAAHEKLTKDLQQTLQENPAELEQVWKKIADADKRYTEARVEVRQILDRLDTLHDELGALQDEQLAALDIARQRHDEASEAEGILNRLQNPFSPRNLLQWLLDHGPKLLTILVGTLLLALIVKFSGRQIAQVVARSGSRGTAHDRENRAITLVGVFRNTTSIALVAGGVLMALDEVGIPIGPLMGGAAVLGLAVAFGAQNLIRDYFSGFMVLLEDQYGIGDVVKIGDVAGNVEKITLRMTVLRDMEGALHFIPHGSITRVTNMTHGWSRAVVDIGVAYKEDSERVMQTLMEIGKEMRKDPTYGPVILDGPEMLGLDNLADSAVVFKFFLKTQPLQRWFVRRELLRRIKRRFDELGIEIPFPQRTVHHRYDNGELDPAKVGATRPAGGNGGI